MCMFFIISVQVVVHSRQTKVLHVALIIIIIIIIIIIRELSGFPPVLMRSSLSSPSVKM